MTLKGSAAPLLRPLLQAGRHSDNISVQRSTREEGGCLLAPSGGVVATEADAACLPERWPCMWGEMSEYFDKLFTGTVCLLIVPDSTD